MDLSFQVIGQADLLGHDHHLADGDEHDRDDPFQNKRGVRGTGWETTTTRATTMGRYGTGSWVSVRRSSSSPGCRRARLRQASPAMPGTIPT